MSKNPLKAVHRLSRPSKWLLWYLYELAPQGVATTTALPVFDYRDQPKMAHILGLLRRGWAYEAREGNKPFGQLQGVFFITAAGMAAMEELGVSKNKRKSLADSINPNAPFSWCETCQSFHHPANTSCFKITGQKAITKR